MQSPTDSDLRELFAETRTIAVLGAHTDPGKPACYVPDYLAAHNYEIHAVNPLFTGRTLWGHPCVAALTKPYNEPDGALNACLQCDEDKSGPVFKAVAGRTRRNTGLANALCRPCSEVRPLLHRYD